MSCDGNEHITFVLRPSNRIEIHLKPDVRAEAGRLFGLLAAGGHVDVPLQPGCGGTSFGTLTDKLGIHWTVICGCDAPA